MIYYKGDFMKRKVKELKRIARSNLTGNYTILMRAYIWLNMLILLVEMPFSMMQNDIAFSSQNIIYRVAQVLISVLSVILVCGQYRMHLSVARTGKAEFKDFWEPLKNQPDRYIITNFILFGITLICLLPMFGGLWLWYQNDSLENTLIALGLSCISVVLYTCAALNFNLVFFLMIDDQTLTAVNALKSTYHMVMHYKKRYLYLQLSFLGYMFLNLLTFGIGILWIESYMTQTITLFYLDIKGELDAVQTERRKNETIEPTTFNAYV
ncbi:MAG: DUF975 family protein [Lachnospiraceae bacterium]|nr:DUF975 family protein [Lachnospiraceae bacterium]